MRKSRRSRNEAEEVSAPGWSVGSSKKKSTRSVPSKAHWQCTHKSGVARGSQSMGRLVGSDGECIYVMWAWVSCLIRIIRHLIVCVCLSVYTQQAQCHTCAHYTSYQYCYIERVNAGGRVVGSSKMKSTQSVPSKHIGNATTNRVLRGAVRPCVYWQKMMGSAYM